MWLTRNQLRKLDKAELKAFRSPVPTQMVSNGEYMPLAQTKQQREVEARIKAHADEVGRKLKMDRRAFLQTMLFVQIKEVCC